MLLPFKYSLTKLAYPHKNQWRNAPFTAILSLVFCLSLYLKRNFSMKKINSDNFLFACFLLELLIYLKIQMISRNSFFWNNLLSYNLFAAYFLIILFYILFVRVAEKKLISSAFFILCLPVLPSYVLRYVSFILFSPFIFFPFLYF